MEIKLKNEEETLILSDEELDNPNFVSLEFYDEDLANKDNEKGFIVEAIVDVEELKLAIDAFYQRKLNNKQYE
jgi:hypothetical protein